MNKRVIPILIVIFFLLSSLNGVSLTPNTYTDYIESSEDEIFKTNSITIIDKHIGNIQDENVFEKSIFFSPPELQKTGNYFKIRLKEQTSQTMLPNKPLLPVVTHQFIFPFTSKINDVNVCFYEQKNEKISHPIFLSPEPVTILDSEINEISSESKDLEIYPDLDLYPEKQYRYHVHAGRYNDEIVNFLVVNIFPIQYDSSKNTIYYWDQANIYISYNLPQKSTTFGDEYDLLIISPKKFSNELTPLVDHKNDHGVRTKLVTLNEILWGFQYPKQGRDRAEKVKYFIKHALDEWGIKYVLLVGGRKGGILKPQWWVPVRYSNIVDFSEYSFLCDQYFSDIYDSEGNFSSWDTNNNNVFAEWYDSKKDNLDMYPEVHVGRLPCKNISELKIIVDKIIKYENTAYGEDWVNKFVGVGGDTYANYTDPYYEGELATQASFDCLNGFQAEFLWTSNGTFLGREDVITAINKGCGFMYFSGHGNPREWCTHPPNDHKGWICAPDCFETDSYTNNYKLPVVLVGACWSSLFSTGKLNIIKGILKGGLRYFKKGAIPSGYYSWDWMPQCWSWSIAAQSGGGSIATIGNSGLGSGLRGEECISGRSLYHEIQFFKGYSQGLDVLGETQSNQKILYMNEFPPMEDRIDCKTVQQSTLFGDPSLKIGGYPPE